METEVRLLPLAALLALFASVNPGRAQTWTQTSAPITNWNSIASSADGRKFVAGVWGGGIYASTNSGATWTPTSAPRTAWSAVASSADGTKLVAAACCNNDPIYTSTNSGTTWTQTSAP